MSKATSSTGVQHPRLLLAAFAGALAALVAAVALLAGAAPNAAADSACPNEAIRSEQGEAGLALPDCRAYEVVSPPTSSPVKESYGNISSLSGNRVAYRSWNPYTGQERESLRYVAERQADGWSIFNPTPAQNGAKADKTFACNASFAVTPEIDHLLLVDGYHAVGIHGELETEGEECIGDEPALDPGEARGYANIFRTEPAGTSYTLMNRPPAGVEGRNGELAAYSSDGSVAVFTERAQLTPDAPNPESEREGEALYLSQNGVVHYVAYLPDGTPVLAYLANAGSTGNGGGINSANITHAVSSDGESIVFERESEIYLREHALREQSAINGEECTEPAKACTIPIDVSEEGPSEYQEPGYRRRFNRHFLYATPDGSRIFFMDDRKLTPDANTVLPVKNHYQEYINGKSDLYEYDVATGETTDLTTNDGGEPANVRGFAGAAEDGSYIYFVAFGDLTAGQQNSNGDTAQAGHNNLYVLHEGSVTYIATMTGGEAEPTGGESGNWGESPTSSPANESTRDQNNGSLGARLSVDGKFLLFPTAARITEFDNTPAEPEDCESNTTFGAVPGAGCTELYLYDVETQQIECVSCSPEGDAPATSARLPALSQALEAGNGNPPVYIQHLVSSDGAAFFQTSEALVPADENGELDVYEYEDGAPHLISSGVAQGPTRLIDASVDGRNVFFTTGQSLVGGDVDNSASLYDARVDGGFTEPPPLPGCEGEACRGAASGAAATPAAGTAQFKGPGNRIGRHKQDCSLFSKQALKQSKKAKGLRRRASKTQGKSAAKLRRKAGKLAAKSKELSKKAKTCRRQNRGAGK